MEPDEPQVINMQQCADVLGIHTHQLRKLMGEGKVPYYQLRKQVYFLWPEVRDALLASK